MEHPDFARERKGMEAPHIRIFPNSARREFAGPDELAQWDVHRRLRACVAKTGKPICETAGEG